MIPEDFLFPAPVSGFLVLLSFLGEGTRILRSSSLHPHSQPGVLDVLSFLLTPHSGSEHPQVSRVACALPPHGQPHL